MKVFSIDLNEITKKIADVKRFCLDNKIPYYMAFVTQNSETSTNYTQYLFSAFLMNITLNRDNINTCTLIASEIELIFTNDPVSPNEKATVYDKFQLFDSIKNTIIEICNYCKKRNIPYYMTFAIKNDKNSTDYAQYLLPPQDMKLENDYFPLFENLFENKRMIVKTSYATGDIFEVSSKEASYTLYDLDDLEENEEE